MLNLTMLGYLDQARQQARSTISLAEEIGHPLRLPSPGALFPWLPARHLTSTGPWRLRVEAWRLRIPTPFLRGLRLVLPPAGTHGA